MSSWKRLVSRNFKRLGRNNIKMTWSTFVGFYHSELCQYDTQNINVDQDRLKSFM